MPHLAVLFIFLLANLTTSLAVAVGGTVKALTTSSSSLHWKSCPSPFPPTFQCANLSAPLNYSQPTAEKITLNVVKIPAKDPSRRIGSWIFQEGGPGLPTAEHLIGLDKGVGWQKLQEKFDVLALDPRGVGRNYPIKCSPKLWNQYVKELSYPKTEAQWKQTLDSFGDFGDDCRRRTGEKIWPTLDTGTAARDLETLRVALDEGGINYYGLSCGSQRGQQYAQLYPNNIRAMILDAVVDHTVSVETSAVSSAVSFGRTADIFYQWASTNKSPALHGQDVESIFKGLLAQLDKKPATLPECALSGKCSSTVTGQNLLSAFGGQLDYTSSFPDLARGIAQAAKGNFTGLASPIQTAETSSQFSFMIACNDWYTNETYAEFANRQKAEQALSCGDYNGATAESKWMIYCPKWPTEVVNPPKPLNIANTSAPVLLVNAIWDPATGYDGAVNVQRQIGGSVLLTRRGEGHGSMSSSIVGETQRLMIDYLITGKLPAAGTVAYS